MPTSGHARRKATRPSKQQIGRYDVLRVDAFEWLASAKPCSVHAVVTDPPYGLIEYTASELSKRKKGSGGVWRIPPSFDGCKRMPIPRFTILKKTDKKALEMFFDKLARGLMRVLVPGAHVFVATNPLVSLLVYGPFVNAGFEKRAEIVRVVHTLRGGDRPKGAHKKFADVTVMPKSCWEPWGLFRKPTEGRVQDNLRKWHTGGLRRVSPEEPFKDMVWCPPARGRERQIAAHPSLKPQALLRHLVRAALPLGKGMILDPFMGSGSTIAAAAALGFESIGLEVNPDYFRMAVKAIPRLSALPANGVKTNGSTK